MISKKSNARVLMGRRGEKLASDFLTQQGYTLLAQNYRYKKGEIDIIVSKSDILIFVEVKTRKNSLYGYPEESAMRESKKEKIIETAEGYVMEINWKGNIRFDIISVILRKVPEIKQFTDVF
ncbi:MAG: YraN family protein [Chitinophagaceae bacterium]|nr:YraN family protein [Chitinophagaceae bacterium]